jgi:hypothetical protein
MSDLAYSAVGFGESVKFVVRQYPTAVESIEVSLPWDVEITELSCSSSNITLVADS